MMKKREHIRIIRGSQEETRKIRILREIGGKGAGALRPIDIMNHNIPSPLHRASESQKTIIRAWIIPRQRTWIDSFVNEKTDSGIYNTWVE
jgi:hypothetical protein